MLEIRKGKSTKSYENVFFRKISEELSQIFKQKNWNGILLGMPECNTRDDLQIDCLLVTEQQIILIDFKNYCGTLELPSEDSFNYGKWIMNNEEIVKGGSSSNPYLQIGKQRKKLIEQLGRRLHNFDNKSVSTIVCFHEKTQIIGTIPRKYQIGFSITDATNYHHKIVDIIDVVDGENKNYLSENGRKVFLETLFTAAPYEFDVQFEEVIKESPVNTPEVSEFYTQQINEFLTSDSRIMILTGNTKSGKTSLIPTIRDQAFDCHFTDVPVFAYSNRIRRKMLESNPHLEEVESLYGTIFDFTLETVDQSYKKSIPLRKQDEVHDEEKTLYIIDDSQLITNSNFDTELLQFGSGLLLDDILQYIDLKSHPKRKILFIGDKNKLSYGLKIENALNPDYLKTLLELKGINSEVFEIELPENKKHTEIINVCNKIAKSIQAERYNHLLIHTTAEIAFCGKGQQRELLERAYTNPQTNKILVFSNNQASQVNQWIKKYIIQNGSNISVKDYVIFNSTIKAYAPNLLSQQLSPFDHSETAFSFVEPKRIDNGFFGEVVHIHYVNTIEKVLEVNGNKVSLKFIPCHIKLQDGSTVETYIFDNYLQAEKNELNKNEMIAYQMVLARYEKDLLAQEPFENSPEFAQMLASNDYIQIEDDGKKIYRRASDRRKLTEFEKAYRQRVLKKLSRPDSEYFRLYNAAKVKFGWAMTVNKAMAYSFEHVFFNVKQGESNGRTNKDYFKWLYTGISTALSEMQLINWEPITPFFKTEFQKLAPLNPPTPKGCMLSLSNEGMVAQQLQQFLENQLGNDATILKIDSKSYLEIVTLEIESRKIELFFDFNGKGEIKFPRRKSGDEHDFKKIVELLKTNTQELSEEIGEMKSYLEELSSILLEHDIKMTVPQFGEWNIILNFRKQQNELNVQLWYNGENMISKFNYLNGEENLFDEIVDVIHAFYGLSNKLVRNS